MDKNTGPGPTPSAKAVVRAVYRWAAKPVTILLCCLMERLSWERVVQELSVDFLPQGKAPSGVYIQLVALQTS